MRTKIPVFAALLLCCLLSAISRADITSGLVLYLPLDETSGSTAADATANHLNATLVNMPTDDSEWVAGFYGNALNFDTSKGTTQAAQVANNALLNFESAKVFSVALWAKIPPPGSANPTILHKGVSGSEQFVVDVNSSGNYRFYVRNSANGVTQINSGVAANNTWQHVVAVFNQASGTMLLYVNGAQAASGTPPASLKANTNPLNIGSRQTSSGFAQALNGTVDELRVYNRALSLSDVQELHSYGRSVPPMITGLPLGGSRYVGDPISLTVAIDASSIYPRGYQWYRINGAVTNLLAGATNATLTFTNLQLADDGDYSVAITNAAGITNSPPVALSVLALPAADLASGLAAHWTFDETGGTTAADASGNGNSGTLFNFLEDNSQWTPGVLANALNKNNFGNIGEVVSVPDAPGLNFDTNSAAASTFSLSAWIQMTVPAGNQTNGAGILCKGAGSGGESYCVDHFNNAFRFYVRPFGGGGATVVSSGIPANGLWQHVVAVFDATNRIMWVYVNGQRVAAGTPPAAGVQQTSHELSLGNRELNTTSGYNQPFWGRLDDVRIYNRALNSADVRGLYLLAGVYPPSISTQPQSASRYAGDSVSFAPVIGGTTPLSYQWFKNSALLAGRTDAGLTLTNLQLGDAGAYSLQVSNEFGVVLSSNAVLQVSAFDLANTLAHWRFDETSGLVAADASGSYTGTLEGFPGDDSQWVAGRIGLRGLNCNVDGSLSEVVTVPDSPALNFNSSLAFSLSAWVKGAPGGQQAPPATPTILCKGAGAGGEQYGLDVQYGVFRFFVRNAGAATVSLPSGVSPSNRWQHVVATFDSAAGTMKVYVNGQLAGSGTPPTSLLANTHALSIGSKESSAGSGYNLPFQGTIDDVRLYAGHALSAAEVQGLYAAAGTTPLTIDAQPQGASRYVCAGVSFSVVADGTDPLSYQWQKNGADLSGATHPTLTLTNLQLGDAGTYRVRVTDANTSVLSANAALQVLPLPAPDLSGGLVACWTFDETSGLGAADASGNGNSASLYNFPGDDSAWVPGIVGGALQFNADGSGQTFVLTDGTLQGLQNADQFTFSFWARQAPGAIGHNPRLIGPANAAGTDGWVLWHLAPATGVGFYPAAPSPQPAPDAWHHFTVAFDRAAGLYSLYVDGVLQVAERGTYTRTDPSPFLWIIGHSENVSAATETFTGVLDDVRIYNRLLNLNDARALYYTAGQPQLSATHTETGLVLSWPAAATGFHLQSATTLSASNTVWTDVTAQPATSADGLNKTVTENTLGESKFYRLAKP